jgi:hypothetical protein
MYLVILLPNKLVMFSTLNAIEFQKQFIDNNSCLEYLAEMKWKDG